MCRACINGELAISDICRSCKSMLNDQFTFNEANATCDVCPEGTDCFGSFIVPDQGVWHSHPRSTVMHRCPLPGGCTYGDRQDALKVSAGLPPARLLLPPPALASRARPLCNLVGPGTWPQPGPSSCGCTVINALQGAQQQRCLL